MIDSGLTSPHSRYVAVCGGLWLTTPRAAFYPLLPAWERLAPLFIFRGLDEVGEALAKFLGLLGALFCFILFCILFLILFYLYFLSLFCFLVRCTLQGEALTNFTRFPRGICSGSTFCDRPCTCL